MTEKSNPAFRSIVVGEETASSEYSGERATYGGISLKTFLCFLLSIATGIGALFIPVELLYVLLVIGPIAAFISAMIGIRSLRAAMPCSIIYSMAEGLSLGVITALCDAVYPGIASAAILATITVFGVSLFFYATGLVRASGRMRKFVLISLVSIMVISLVAMIASLFGNFVLTELFYGYGLVSILVSVFCVFVAAFCLIIDFDDAASVVRSGADKRYEWVSALGLMVSIVYLYYQILRILIILFANNRD